jgi:hypothetical protein
MLWILLTAGCLHPAAVSLSPIDGSEASAVSDVSVTHSAAWGWEFEATLTLTNPSPTQRRRVDLTRAALRVDGGGWERCRHSEETDELMLMLVLEPGEEKQRTLRCVEIISPQRSLAIRYVASGSGVVVVEYARVDR